jgi:hypothetical protein
MNSYFLKGTLFLFLGSFAASSSLAAPQTSDRDTESPYLEAIVDEIDYQRNTLTYYGVKYRYTVSTLIKLASQQKATEYTMTPGTAVSLLKDPSTKGKIDGAVMLSEIIIKEIPAE